MSYCHVAGADIGPWKDELITLVSSFLIKEPPLGSSSSTSCTDPRANSVFRMRSLVHWISAHDGEFVLKLALYVRHELNVRNTANFLAALSAREERCQPFLDCYLQRLIRLPSDWLSIANFAYFRDADTHAGGVSSTSPVTPSTTSVLHRDRASTPQSSTHHLIPSGLRKALVNVFRRFDEFSLAKYNNDSAERRKRRKVKRRASQPEGGDGAITADATTAAPSPTSFTYKQLIRLLHIAEPAYEVCCILGKRYPQTVAEFDAAGFAGDKGRTFDPLQAGRRMRLAVPITWETKLSEEGNRGAVWDALVLENRVPYMALLRNLRNVLTCRCSEATHASILATIAAEDRVAESRQLPYRFTSAHAAVKFAAEDYRAAREAQEPSPPSKKKSRHGAPQKPAGTSKVRHPCELPLEQPHIFFQRVQAYGEALDAAVAASTRLNLVPMRGTAVVVLCLHESMEERITAVGGGAIGSWRTKMDVAALLGVLASMTSEDATIILATHHAWETYHPPPLAAVGLLESVRLLCNNCCQLMYKEMVAAHPPEDEENDAHVVAFPFRFLDAVVEKHMALQSLLVVDEGHHTYASMNADAPSLGDLPIYLSRLRRMGSDDLVYVGINIGDGASATGQTDDVHARFSHRNDLLVTGFSDSILRLVAERANGGARAVVERMDDLYDVNRSRVGFGRVLARERHKVRQRRRKSPTDTASASMGLSTAADVELEDATTTAINRYSPVLVSPNVKDASASLTPAATTSSRCKSFVDQTLSTAATIPSVFSWQVPKPPSSFRTLKPAYGPAAAELSPMEADRLHHSDEANKDASATTNTAHGSGRTFTPGVLTVVPPQARRMLLASVHRPHLSSYRECRFFLSSTFMDMENERNALVLEVFPRARRWAADCGIKVTLIEVDLRWGITAAATGENLSTSVCLNEVSRCAPFFIGMLGSRYGYCPRPIQVVADVDVEAEDFEWISDLSPEVEGRLSVTELEMRHSLCTARRRKAPSSSSVAEGGALESPYAGLLFFARDDESLQKSLPADERVRKAYAPDTPSTRQRIGVLQQHIESSGATLVKYHAPFMTLREVATATRKDPLGLSLASASPSLRPSFPASMDERPLTSREVLLDTREFVDAALTSLKGLLARVGGFATAEGPAPGSEPLVDLDLPDPATRSRPAMVVTDFYDRLGRQTLMYGEGLMRLYIPPSGLVNALVSFAQQTATVGELQPRPTPSGGTAAPDGNVFLLTGGDGDGKSSACAALFDELMKPSRSETAVVFYAAQSGDGSLRSMLLFLCATVVVRAGLEDEFDVHEQETTQALASLLPRLYAAVAKQRLSLAIILDGLERLTEWEELLRVLGVILHPASHPCIRFVVTARSSSRLAMALQSRSPSPISLSIPELRVEERAQLVRRHLASYGKRLQETMELNELKDLLRKREAGRPSYLTAAMLYLRLFSTFDSLREDMRALAGTTDKLYQRFVKELERRYEPTTCRQVLTTLALRQCVGGIMEYNLFRLVANVAAASRLLALLCGPCLGYHHGRYFIVSSFFELCINSMYLAHTSDRMAAYEAMLVAELLYQPLDPDAGDRASHRERLREVMLSIQRSGISPSSPCLFHPSRHSPRDLLGILHSAVAGGQWELATTFVGYLPFLETLLRAPGMLPRFMSLLAQLSAVPREPILRRVRPIVDFFSRHQFLLASRPGLVRQCVLNMPTSFSAISRFGTATTEQCGGAAEAETNFRLSAAATITVAPHEEAAEPGWVGWSNRNQHGGENRTAACRPMGSLPIRLLAVNPSANLIAYTSGDCVVKVGPMHSPELVTVSLKHAAEVTAMCFELHEEEVLLTGCERGILYVWRVSDSSLLQKGVAHLRRISTIACHPMESIICTGGDDANCILWDILGTTSSVTTALRAQGSTASPRPSKSSKSKPSAAHRMMTLRDTLGESGPPLIPVTTMRHHRTPVASVAFHAAGDVLATGAWDGQVYLIDLRAYQPKAYALKSGVVFEYKRYALDAPVRLAVFVPTLVITCAVGTFSGAVHLLDYAAGQSSQLIHVLHTAPITAMTVSPDGRLLATADERGRLRVSYTGVRGTELCSLNGHRQRVTALTFVGGGSSPSSALMSAGMDGQVQFWSVEEPETASPMPSSHASTVTVLAVSYSGTLYVSGCEDGRALVFGAVSTPATSQQRPAAMEPLFELSHDGSRVTAVAFALGSTQILVGVASGDVFIWSSTPGLNRREGRLLRRIHVPAHGRYPVVGLECHDVLPSMPNHADAASAATVLPSTALLMALCSNGEYSSFPIYGDGVSMATLLKQVQLGSSTPSSHAKKTEEDDRAPMIVRRRISWMAPTTTAGNASMEPSVSDSDASMKGDGDEEDALSSTRIGDASPTVCGGEEVLQSVPLFFQDADLADGSSPSTSVAELSRCASGLLAEAIEVPAPRASHTMSIYREMATRDYVAAPPLAGAAATWRRVEAHEVLLVGQQTFFCLSVNHGLARRVTVSGPETGLLSPTYPLQEEEHYTALSEPLILDPTRGLLALATNTGRLLVMRWTHHVSTVGTHESRLALHLIWSSKIPTLEGGDTEQVVVDALRLAPCPSSQSPHPTPPMLPLWLIVGCRDCSTRVLSVEVEVVPCTTECVLSSPLTLKRAPPLLPLRAPILEALLRQAFTETAVFVAAASLSALAVSSVQTTSTTSPLQWLAGDSLGNIYQLSLQCDARLPTKQTTESASCVDGPPHFGGGSSAGSSTSRSLASEALARLSRGLPPSMLPQWEPSTSTLTGLRWSGWQHNSPSGWRDPVQLGRLTLTQPSRVSLNVVEAPKAACEPGLGVAFSCRAPADAELQCLPSLLRLRSSVQHVDPTKEGMQAHTLTEMDRLAHDIITAPLPNFGQRGGPRPPTTWTAGKITSFTHTPAKAKEAGSSEGAVPDTPGSHDVVPEPPSTGPAAEASSAEMGGTPEDEAFFGILLQSAPPQWMSPAERRVWWKQQQHVAQMAMRIARENRYAKSALASYSQRLLPMGEVL